MRKQMSCIAFLCAMVIAGCNVLGDDGAADTNEALARWQAADLKHYEVEQRRVFICNLCDGGTDEQFARVIVRNGEVAEVYDEEGAFIIVSEVLPHTPLAAYALTVDAVFERILALETIENNHFEAEFDAALSYPRRFYMEMHNGEVREEILLRGLRPL